MSDEPICAQNSPYVIEEGETTTRMWCACGRSANQPYCDGAHAGTSFRPVPVQVEAGKKVAWCGCRKSAQGATCDGAHAR